MDQNPAMVKNDLECNFCGLLATKRAYGFVDLGGGDEGYVYQPVCDTHVKDFQDWLDDDNAEWFDDPRLHGFAYIEYIEDIKGLAGGE